MMEEEDEETSSSQSDELHQLQLLRDKNTESFKCLAKIIVSHSSILRHPLYPFPPLQHTDLDEAVFYQEEDLEHDGVGVQKYLELCKSLKIVPLSRVLNSLDKTVLNLKYFGLNEKQTKAITETLMRNKFVQQLNLQDSWISEASVRYISAMLGMNTSICLLNLRECRLLSEGAAALNSGILNSKYLTELDLSFNGLEDRGLECLEDCLGDSHSLKILNLSHNNLGEPAASTLSSILTFNNTLTELDLSWNNFNTGKGNKLLFVSLGENESIQKLNLAWNSIGTNEATKPIMNYLAASTSLTDFDISNNRLTDASFRNVKSGISRCKKLKSLKIGYNLLKPEEAAEVIRCFATVPKLAEIDMQNTFVMPDFIPLLSGALKKGKQVTIGGVLDNHSIKGPDRMKLLFERANFLAKKKKKDFGVFIGQLPNQEMLIEDFMALLKKTKIKIDADLLTAILQKFPAPKQKVNCNDLQATYIAYYPNTVITYKPPIVEPPPEAEVVQQN